jgi:hypothetical protein
MARLSEDRLGVAWRGMAPPGRVEVLYKKRRSTRHGVAGFWQGEAGHRQAGHREVRRGWAPPGRASPGWAGHGVARQCEVRRGSASYGKLELTRANHLERSRQEVQNKSGLRRTGAQYNLM